MATHGARTDRRRSILHVDMDAFFVSVELRRRPDLVGQPVVVGGTGPRGVVAAASYEARRFGVFSAMPSAVARRRCAHAVFLPGDHALYSEVSAEVREIFDRFTPLVEPLSLDEAFLDVTGSTRLFGPAEQIARTIRHTVESELSLTCSVGIAPNKFLAKMASVEAKPVASTTGIVAGAGITVVDADDVASFLDPLPVQRLWGVGPKTLTRLQRIGIHRVADLTAIDEGALVAGLGVAQASHLLALARGVDDRPVETDREAKSISHEETFQRDLTTPAQLRTELARLADAVATRVRRSGVGARTLTLKLRFSADFQTLTRSTTAGEPIDQAETIVALLQPLLDAIDPSPGVRLLGVGGSNLAPVHHQMTLDEADDSAPVHGARGAALDLIRERFGDDAIGPASAVRRGALRNVEPGRQQWGPNSPEPPEVDRPR